MFNLIIFEWELETGASLLIGLNPSSRASLLKTSLLSLNQIVELLDESEIGSLIIVQIEAQISSDLPKPLLARQYHLIPQ